MTEYREEQAAVEGRPPARTIVIVGLEIFADALRQQGIEVVVVHWHPPAKLPTDIASMLEELL